MCSTRTKRRSCSNPGSASRRRPLGNLPLPRLVDVQIDPRATIDYSTLRQQLTSIIPDAQLDDNRSWLTGVRAFALRIEGVITAGVAAAAALIVTIIVFTARIGFGASPFGH